MDEAQIIISCSGGTFIVHLTHAFTCASIIMYYEFNRNTFAYGGLYALLQEHSFLRTDGTYNYRIHYL